MVNQFGRQGPGKWTSRSGHVVSVYRILAFAVGIAQLLADTSAYSSAVSPIILIVGIGIYLLVTAFYPFRWYTGISVYIVTALDLAIGIFLVTSTGGFRSPFLLFTLSPIVMSSLFLDIKIAASIAALSGIYVLVCHLCIPFFPAGISSAELGYYIVYLMTAGLISALPYLINVNVRQRLRYDNILRERQRLSREIHDGAAQTVSALRWQIQLLHRRLNEKGIDLNDVKELENLADKAQQETRESLELLRNYTGDGSFLPHLKDYLEHLKQDTGIDIHFDTGNVQLNLGAVAELELLRICQEALTNIRNHSGAHNVWINVKKFKNHVEVTIADDGHGFDVGSFYHNGTKYSSHGLAVMNERAQSVGGKFRVAAMPSHGTEIQVEIPTNEPGSSLWEGR